MCYGYVYVLVCTYVCVCAWGGSVLQYLCGIVLGGESEREGGPCHVV